MNLQSQFKKTLRKIKLSKKDKIIVALSGGKDSSVTAYLLKKFGYNIEGFHIDLKIGKYSEECLESVNKLCKQLDIKFHIYDIKKEMGSGMCYLRSAIQSKQKKGMLKNCAVCGVLKKWILNKEARRLKAKAIATGHHLDDEVQTFMTNIFKGSPELSSNSGPISKNIKDKKLVPRIKPLFHIFEDDIREFSKKNKLPVNYDKCPCAIDSYRIQVREFINTLPRKDKANILKNSEQILKKIKMDDSKIQYCEMCGEPSRKQVCKKCMLME
ncbi:adenine nucleotide alpha hydrolase family protein [Candidatus Pacearchaeota archaeon]|nr:adenine nucleotide alpha hydrolase family protein [Candidatus Pacearchaeota archaeon]